jgi:polyisoprenoid-binding protein YceI
MNVTQKRVVIAGAALIGLVVAGVVSWLLFSGNAPEEATLGDAVDVVQSSPPTSVAPTATTGRSTTIAPEGVDGTWTVDTSIGEFSFQDATSSFVGFRVVEELQGIGAVDAVGRTPDVTGSIEIVGTAMTAGTFTAELATLTTDRSRRDNAVRRALGVTEFPTATFAIDGPVDFGSVPADGQSISVSSTGQLTVKGVTAPVEFRLDAQLVDDVIVVVGQIPVVFADFGVAVPSAPVVLSASDEGIVEFQLFFTR